MLALFVHHAGDVSLSLNLLKIFTQHRATLLGEQLALFEQPLSLLSLQILYVFVLNMKN